MRWSGLFFGCSVGGSFGESAGKFYPEDKKGLLRVFGDFWVFPFLVVWGLLSSRRSRSKRRDGFPPACLALCLISVCLCVSWSGRKFWVGWISPLGV